MNEGAAGIEAAAVIAYAQLTSQFPPGFFGDDPLLQQMFCAGYGCGMEAAILQLKAVTA